MRLQQYRHLDNCIGGFHEQRKHLRKVPLQQKIEEHCLTTLHQWSVGILKSKPTAQTFIGDLRRFRDVDFNPSREERGTEEIAPWLHLTHKCGGKERKQKGQLSNAQESKRKTTT